MTKTNGKAGRNGAAAACRLLPRRLPGQSVLEEIGEHGDEAINDHERQHGQCGPVEESHAAEADQTRQDEVGGTPANFREPDVLVLGYL